MRFTNLCFLYLFTFYSASQLVCYFLDRKVILGLGSGSFQSATLLQAVGSSYSSMNERKMEKLAAFTGRNQYVMGKETEWNGEEMEECAPLMLHYSVVPPPSLVL